MPRTRAPARPHPRPPRRGDGSRRERGAAAVEFALVMPLLLMILFGVIGYGFMLSFRQAISQAAAEGARTAAVLSPTLGDAELVSRARTAVNDALGSYGVKCQPGGTLASGGDPAGVCTISARQPCSNAATAECVKVTLDYTYRADPLVPAFPGLGVVLPEHLSYVTEAQVN